MTTWNEADHPRDDEGKFTFKNGGVSNKESYEDKMQRRADILYPTMKDKLPKVNYDNIGLGLGNFVKEKLSREDILFPTMKDKKEIIKEEPNIEQIKINKKDIGYVTGGAADIKKNINNISADKRNHVPDTKRALEILGLNSNDYVLNGNTISTKEIEKDYEEIDELKYPKNSNNPDVEKLKQEARQKVKNTNNEYLQKKAKFKQKAVDHIDNPIFNLGARMPKIGGKEAVENLHMSKTDSYLDTDYARVHQVLNNYKEMPEVLHEYFNKKIPQQVGTDKLDNMKGIFIDEKSKSSQSLRKNLLNDKEFLNKLKKYGTALNNKFSINDSIRLKGSNWYNAVGHADIRDMHINKNGDLELYIADVYDFNEDPKGDLNKIGRNRQEKGEITPYFYAYRVIIPREKWKKH